MDVNRRRRRLKCLVDPPLVLFCFLLFILLRVPFACSSTLYFTNNNYIDRLQNNVITSVIDAKNTLQALDCNSCDDRIYWINEEKMIKRSFPNASSSIESVLSYGITNPAGVAVDWRGNNVYFTDQINETHASVEVVTCDGKYRRVLFRGGPISYKTAGPIVVDSHHGYIFFTDPECCIWRANMDGSDPKKIVTEGHVQDLAIDYNNSVLYWINGTKIYSSDYNGGSKTMPITSMPTSVKPVGVSFNDGVLYWTEEKTESSNGAIYSFVLESEGQPDMVDSNNTSLDPHDISAFVSKEVIASVTGGCSTDNGGCSHFCFTIPNISDPLQISSSAKCACRTGFSLNSNNKTCVIAPLRFLLVGEGPHINILSLDIPDEQILLPLPISAEGTIDYITYDRTHEYMYWTQRNPPAIWQSRLNGEDSKCLVSESVSLPEGIVVSDEGTNLYWADSYLDKIEILSLHNRDESPLPRRTLIDTGLEHPIGLAINESIGYIYWTDIGIREEGMEEGLVEEAAKDGTHRAIIYTANHLPRPITVDWLTGDVYWADSHVDKLGIYKRDSKTGETIQLGISLTDPYQNVLGLTVLDDTLYWTDQMNGQVFKRGLTSQSGVGRIVANNLGLVTDITSVNDNLGLASASCAINNGGCEDICVVSSDGSGRTCLCRTHFKLDSSGTNCKEERPATLIFSTNENVRIFSEKDGSFIKEHYLPIAARAMDVDYSEQMLYWIGYDGIIYRSEIVDSSPNASNYTYTNLMEGYSGYATDLLVDWWGRNLYWTDMENGIVWVSKLDGTNRQSLMNGLNSPTHIAVDPYESTLYVVEDGTKIRTISMNGMEEGILLETQLPIKDLTIDQSNHVLYWIIDVEVFEYDLRSPSSKASEIFQATHPLAFIGVVNNILRAYLKGTDRIMNYNVATHQEENDGYLFLINDNPLPFNNTSFVINHYSSQPDVHWCTKTNGECGGDPQPLCLVSNHYDRTCRCESTEFIDVTYDGVRGVCRMECRGSPSFLLLSTNSKVFHLPLHLVSSDGSSGNGNCVDVDPPATELPLGEIGNIQAISYNPLNKRIIWANSRDDTINSITLSGDHQQELGRYNHLEMTSMSYDWKGGSLIWTEEHATKISAVTHDGRASSVIYDYTYNLGEIWEPIKVVVDSKNNVVYWSRSSDFSLNKLDLFNYKSERVKPETLRKLNIQLMAFEPNKQILFWYNNYNGRGALEQYDISTNSLTPIVEVGSSHQEKITAMAATTFQGNVCLFWYNESDWSVYYYNSSDRSVNKYRQLAEHTVILSMAAHDEDEFVRDETSELCNSRPCSDFCSNNQCICPPYKTLLDNYECSDLKCDNFNYTCNDNSSCYKESERCNGFKDCDDGSDEEDCPGGTECEIGEVFCDPVGCESVDSLCLSDHDCFKERCSCISSNYFQCHSEKERTCLPDAFKCDGERDCMGGYDENECPTTATASTPISSPTQSTDVTSSTETKGSSLSSAVVSVISVLGAIAVIVSLAICAVTIHCFITRRSKDLVIRHEFPMKPTTSSPPHSPCTSELSINTEVSISTSINTRSTRVEKTSQEAQFIKRLSTISTDPSNPPNSPISRRSFTIGGDNMTMYSELDPPVPPVPNPSVDYDVISEGITSVSQKKYPGVISSSGIPTIDEDHAESPPPPYFHHHHPMCSIYEDEVSIESPYNDYCPPHLPTTNVVIPLDDDISQTTFSMTAHDYHDYPLSDGYLSRDNKPDHIVEERQDDHEEGVHGMPPHPYDCPPPPSPVTVYSIQGELSVEN